jgi:hypothetical protein
VPGPLLAAIPRAVVVTGCLKFYLAVFPEADGLQDFVSTSDPWVSALRLETPTTYDVVYRGTLPSRSVGAGRDLCRTWEPLTAHEEKPIEPCSAL